LGLIKRMNKRVLGLSEGELVHDGLLTAASYAPRPVTETEL